MSKPVLSAHYQSRKPSSIRLAQIEFMKRTDQVEDLNTAIGNVSLPAHPAMQQRMYNLNAADSPFKDGVVKYSATVGFSETCRAFLNIIASSGFKTDGLKVQITDGGSHAMELVILGVCGPAGSDQSPLFMIDAAYTNYHALAKRTGRKTVSVSRTLQENGKFTLPDISEIEAKIEKTKPQAMVVIPYDNPTGHFYDRDSMILLAKLCVKYNLWMISDEAYRELFYVESQTTSIWGITEAEVPGIEGRRISIETASKVWNACGLRVGAIVTDNPEFCEKSVAENTANLCPNVIGQYVFGALAHQKHDDLRKWYKQQQGYYKKMLIDFTRDIKAILPGIIISSPDASIYSVIDVRTIAKPGFDANDFVMYCSQQGKVELNGKMMTLLVAPMDGFYTVEPGQPNPGKTQMRVAYVETPERMKLVPELFMRLFREYESRR